eukprot:scaffold45287_cov67-Phaeocystis_antarctica.AAC.1
MAESSAKSPASFASAAAASSWLELGLGLGVGLGLGLGLGLRLGLGVGLGLGLGSEFRHRVRGRVKPHEAHRRRDGFRLRLGHGITVQVPLQPHFRIGNGNRPRVGNLCELREVVLAFAHLRRRLVLQDLQVLPPLQRHLALALARLRRGNVARRLRRGNGVRSPLPAAST